MIRRARAIASLAIVIAAAAAPWASGRAEQPASSHPAPPSGAPGAPAAPSKPSDPAKPAPMPGLDELLGLPPAAKRPAEGGAPGTPAPGTPGAPGAPGGEPLPGASRDAISTELQRKLTDKAIDDNFKQAVQLMADVASRLAGARDAGIDTQRTQEEIVRRLDALIQAAKEQEQQKSSSQSQSQSQKQSDQQQKPTQQGKQQQQQQQAGANDNRGEVTPPGLKTGALNKEALDAAVAAWGALPERVREALLQGRGDKFSSLYDALTQEYYRRLAEEKPRE